MHSCSSPAPSNVPICCVLMQVHASRRGASRRPARPREGKGKEKETEGKRFFCGAALRRRGVGRASLLLAWKDQLGALKALPSVLEHVLPQTEISRTPRVRPTVKIAVIRRPQASSQRKEPHQPQIYLAVHSSVHGIQHQSPGYPHLSRPRCKYRNIPNKPDRKT